jgi:hypothetical protein
MYISIIGKAGSGKTTLFQALSGMEKSPSGGSHGIVAIDVPDERLEYLTNIFNPKKTVYARVDLSDTIAIDEGDLKNETLNQKSIQQLRSSDAFLLILRNFDNGESINPLADFRAIYTEFILADMAQIESRIERMEKQYGKKDNPAIQQEKALLEKCLDHLNNEAPLSLLVLTEEEDKRIRGFQFLSRKPMMVVVNCTEQELSSAEAIAEDLRGNLPDNIPVLAFCAKLEAELALMSPEEQAIFMDEYGIKETIRGRIIHLAVDTLGLISFLTVGDDECRAWSIKKGMNAQDAAGTIHTDLANKFIRAETVSYEAFVEHGGFAGCKKSGLWRLEGKTYVVQDGDIISIRAGN